MRADLASFLFNCARKNAFFGVRAEILLSRVIASLLSCAWPLLGVVQKYIFLKKYSPLCQYNPVWVGVFQDWCGLPF